MPEVTAAVPRRPAKLRFSDGEVEVTPKDRPRFTISAERATEACQQVHDAERRLTRFEQDLLIPLHDWCMAHVGHVRACYVPLPDTQVRVFIVTQSPRFNFALAKEVAALELRLARAGWRVGVYQLPAAGDESLATFIDPDGALEVYADEEPAPRQSAA